MSTNKLIKSIKTININKKYSTNFGNYSIGSDESSMVIKTTNNNYLHSSINVRKRNSINKLFLSKNKIQSAKLKNKFNLSSKTAIAGEKKTIQKFNNFFNFNNLSNNDIKENKQNQVNLIFNNSVLNNCYNIKNTCVNTYNLKLTKFYNPHHNYYKIIRNEKKIINELISQTKNNFYNNYKIIYSNPDIKKRNYILKCFNSIRKNKNKNIDSKNSIEIIAIGELSIKNNKLKSKKNGCNKISANTHIIFPPSFDLKSFIHKGEKMKLKTMKMTDNIMQNNLGKFKNENQRTIKSALYKSNRNYFFKTLPKNNRNQNNNNDMNFEYSKTSSFEL